MLRLLELYGSMQGEGPNTGKPTVFVRFAGCNLRCPGWPCDTQHAIEPKLYIPEQLMISIHGVVERITKKFPNIQNVCLTGGEPFLQVRNQMSELARLLTAKDRTIEVFTNGTLEWGDSVDWITHFILDWKLPGSGENVTPLASNWQDLGDGDAIKFTCNDEEDFQQAVKIWKETVLPYYKDEVNSTPPVVYCGRVWEGELTNERLVKLILDNGLPWHLNVQTHKYIWDPDKKGV